MEQRMSEKTKGTAILLALLFGGLGVHKFYMNQSGLGVLYFVFSITLIPALISIIDIIMLLCTSEVEFDMKVNFRRTYKK